MSDTVFLKEDTVLIVKPSGRLDTFTSPILETETLPHLDGVRELVLDFKDLDYISSGGIRVVLALEQTMDDRDGDLRIIHAKDHIRKIFHLVGLDSMIDTEAD